MTARKVRLRSLTDLDGRTNAAKQAMELKRQLEQDAGGDLSAAKRELIVRAAILASFVAHCEAEWLSGQEPDVPAWHSAVDRLRRLLETIGLERRARDVTSLADYVASKERK